MGVSRGFALQNGLLTQREEVGRDGTRGMSESKANMRGCRGKGGEVGRVGSEGEEGKAKASLT